MINQISDTVKKLRLIESGAPLRSVKVTFDDGSTIVTDMAAGLSDKEILDYYAKGRQFNIGDTDDKIAAVSDVEILEDVIAKREPSADVYKKRSFADVVKSVESAKKDKYDNLEHELQTKLQKELKKASNGKAELDELQLLTKRGQI